MARAAVALADLRDSLPAFADMPFPGLAFSTADLKAEIERLTGRPLTVRRFTWLAAAAAVAGLGTGAGIRRMRYLYDTPHALSGRCSTGCCRDLRSRRSPIGGGGASGAVRAV